MKILVVFTGGTIGSSVIEGVADVNGTMSDRLLEMYGSSCDNDNTEIQFECVSPVNILSENSTPKTLSQICTFMLSVNYDNYDGVIVTHGSDTLAYTSALLGLVLSWVKIPVVLTASDYVLDLPYSNGLINFKASVDFIEQHFNGTHKNSGVFTVWKNSGESRNANVYISTRLNEADGYLDRFTSWGGVPFGTFENGKFKRIENIINPVYTKPCTALEFLKNSEIKLNDGVILLQSYPGLDYGTIPLNGKSAVVIKLYHSVTACTDGERTSILTFADRCERKNVSVYIFPAKAREYTYESSYELSSKKINSLYNINVCSAYMKVMLAHSLGQDKISDIFNINLFYESLPSRPSSSQKSRELYRP